MALLYLVLTSDAINDESLSKLPSIEVFTALTNINFLKDFAKREGLILLIVIGGFLGAARYNHYLDEIEHQQYLEDKRKRKQERLASGLDGVTESDDTDDAE